MSFEDRKNVSEKQFEMDQQAQFKIEARASKLIGMWAGEQMGLSGDALSAYAKEVVAANLDEPGYDDVKRKLVADFTAKDLEIADNDLDQIIAKFVDKATDQVRQEMGK